MRMYKYFLISDVITNVFEALSGNPALDLALDHNNIHEYDISRISKHVRYCAFFKKKLSKVAQ